MKIACQTILWGSRLDNADETFQTIKKLGFDGVEIFQSPAVLPSPKEFFRLLKKHDLDFVGFYGGRLTDRMKYCADCRPEYLCIENWDNQSCAAAIENGFKLALHPHMFRGNHNLATAAEILDAHPEALFLPDTAHLYVARDDLADALEKYSKRLAAVHLKDWTPKFGHSFHRYARGFVEFGQGIVPIDGVLKTLRDLQYDGWLVIEQDYTSSSPEASAAASLAWLRENVVASSKKNNSKMVKHFHPRAKHAASRAKTATVRDVRLAQFLDEVTNVRGLSVRSFAEAVLKAFRQIIPYKLASLWEFSPTNNLLSLLACVPQKYSGTLPSVLDCSQDMNGHTVDAKVVSFLDPLQPISGRKYHFAKTLQDQGVKSMISIPVLNTYTSSHVELVINLYLCKQNEQLNPLLELLGICAEYVARGYEILLEDICQGAASMVNLAVAASKTSTEFLERVVAIIQDVLNCDGAAIFLIDETGSKLYPAATTIGLTWRVPDVADQFYVKGEGLTGGVWEKGEPLLLTRDPASEKGYRGKSLEKTRDTIKTGLIVPLGDSHGKIIGVVRCINKRPRRTTSEAQLFCQSDLSIIDAIEEAAVPHFLFMLQEERRALTWSRLMHEIKGPVVAIQGAAEFIQMESKEKKFNFSYPYAEDIASWCDLSKSLFHNIDFFRSRTEYQAIKPKSICILKDVFGPARHQVAPLLRERGFSMKSITFCGFDAIPRLWVDKNHFQQIFFNLFTNAVKYCHANPKAFKVEVETCTVENAFLIFFKDWGFGIPEGYEKGIFEEGVRGPNAEEHCVAGDGLGLWIVSRIIQAHGGTIRLSHNSQPTEFRIHLPSKLARHWKPQN